MKIGKINRQSIEISGLTSVLKHYEGMPNNLFVIGSLPKDKKLTVAIVGSRKPTAYGKQVTHQLAFELAKRGVVIVSGLAYGVDAIAHEAALEAGGTTIAVLAGGLHKIYPVAHEALAKRIVESGGALISEHEAGMEAHPYHFLSRNRIVSGLADAVVVTEATDRSGTLSTVAHALDQNKDVFAVPGPITSLLSAGSNRMLQQGAQVALRSQDILDSIAPQLSLQQTKLPLGDTALETRIIQLIAGGVNDGEAIQRRLPDHSTAEVLQALTMLELQGSLRSVGGNTWAIRTLN